MEQDETGKWQNQISAHLDEIVELQRLLLFPQVFGGRRPGVPGCPQSLNGSPYPTPMPSFLELGNSRSLRMEPLKCYETGVGNAFLLSCQTGERAVEAQGR